MRRFSTHFVLFFVFCAFSRSVPAVQLIWDTATWPVGSLTNSFEIDPANTGNDVTLTMTGNTAQFQISFTNPFPQTPAITRAFDGGFSPGHNTLQLAVNFASNAQFITVTMDFSNLYASGVSNVSFNLFDIDFANDPGNSTTYQDVISSITATSATGSTIAPTISALGPNVSLSGSGTTQVLTGTASTADLGVGSGNANATISFNAPDVRSLTFTYASSALFANPTYQHIGIDNLSYSVPVPEPGPIGCCLVGFGMLAARMWYRRAKQKR